MLITCRRWISVSSSVSSAVTQYFSHFFCLYFFIVFCCYTLVKQKFHSLLGKCHAVMHLLTLRYIIILLMIRINRIYKCIQDWFWFSVWLWFSVYTYILWSFINVAFTLDNLPNVLLWPKHLLIKATGLEFNWNINR